MLLPHARRSSGASTDAVFGPCAPVSDEPAVAEWDDPEPAVAVPLELHLGAPLLVQRHGAVAQLVDQACPLAGRRPATAPGRPRARRLWSPIVARSSMLTMWASTAGWG